MDASSRSSVSKSASSLLASGSSAASSVATDASASLSSASVRASGTASAMAADVKTSSTFGISTTSMSVIAIVIGAAYYYGFLDGLIAYLQTLLGQAQDKKEQVMKDNTGHRSVRDAASEQYNAASAKGEKMMNQTAGTENRAYTSQTDNNSRMLSAQTH